MDREKGNWMDGWMDGWGYMYLYLDNYKMDVICNVVEVYN